MARIHELLRQLRLMNAALADDIEREVDVLGARRAFGLNFERHTPEAVELSGRPVRSGDKVHVLPPRGERPNAANFKLWRVVAIEGEGDGRVGNLEPHPRVEPTETATVALADLVVVAEFRDPIYPGLESTGRVERGGDKPFHTVINGENFHALQTLLFSHRSKVDAIYIDPPYNTGAKDWKYNNDYVESDDLYRHSKWLAFMERRLLLAKELLNPDDSVLIVTIDENEHPRLVLLLQQTFPEARITTATIVINPKGTPENGFARIEELVVFVALGTAAPNAVFDSMHGEAPSTTSVRVRWRGLSRTGANGTRAKSPGAYYPIFVRESDGHISGAGEVPPPDNDGQNVVPPPGTVAVWPTPRPDGTLGRWSVVKAKFEELLALGAAKTGKVNFANDAVPLWYLTDPNLLAIENQEIVITGRDSQGALRVEYANAMNKITAVKTVWSRVAHSASEYGSGLLGRLLPGRHFPYPKSLFAVEDTLRPFVGHKQSAVIVDFFAGSGTTTHAVMRLNSEDDGERSCISITNNEVSSEMRRSLASAGLRAGDADWEQWGIYEYVTKPRVIAAISGKTPDGRPIEGEYKYNNEFPMADGMDENVEFLTLTYEAPLRLRANRDFERISPLLWLRAGSRGRRIEAVPKGWDVADAYGVIADLDKTDDFFRALVAAPAATTVFVITDDDGLFEAIAAGLPERLEPVRLYDAYFRNFEIDAMRGAR